MAQAYAVDATVVSIDPIQSSLHHPPPVDVKARDRYMDGLSLPEGIRAELMNSTRDFGLRLWIVDNSGSMSTGDGSKVVTAKGAGRLVRCSRWDELSESIRWHAALASNLGAPVEFRCLNQPAGGPRVVTVGVGGTAHAAAEVGAVEAMLRGGPGGMTPLCAEIRTVVQRIEQVAPALWAGNQRCLVVIASDGAASDGDVAVALEPLRRLPCWLVVRLCTDEDSVVNYWNNIDDELELDVDVIDDHAGEAKEICAHNPWLVYGAPLHRLREWGTCRKIFDMIDERPLNDSESIDLVKLLFGAQAADLPHPALGWAKFKAAIDALNNAAPVVFDPLKNKFRPWLDTARLARTFKRSSCALM